MNVGQITEFIGWIGAVLIVLAYILLSNKKLDSDSKLYQGMNALGAVGVGVNTFVQSAFPALTINAVWACIGTYYFIKALKK